MTRAIAEGLPEVCAADFGYVSVRDAARELGIHEQTVRNLRTNGRMRGWEMRWGQLVMPRETFDRFAAHYNPRRGGRCKS